MRCFPALLFAMLSSALSLRAGAPFTWATNFQPPGTHESEASANANGIVRAVLETDDAIFIGGDFDRVGDVVANHAARYDRATQQWSALGAGTNDKVMALAFTGNVLYAGGDFTQAGGIPAGRLAAWDGSAWSAVGGAHFDGPVRALLLNSVKIGAGPIGTVTSRLFAGGSFNSIGAMQTKNLAVWDGSNWSVPGGGMDGPVHALAAGGPLLAQAPDIYAAGDFSNAGGLPAARVAHFSGGAWSAMGAGLDDRVLALAWDGAGGVYAGGEFTNYLSKWTGSAWTTVSGGTNNTVMSLAWSGSTLYVGGAFGSAGGGSGGVGTTIGTNNIASLTAGVWSPMDGGLEGGGVHAISVRSPRVAAVGEFVATSRAAARNVAEFDGSRWQSITPGDAVNAPVRTFAAANGLVYMGGGGDFTAAGHSRANGVAAWNPVTRTFSPLGAGLEGGAVNVLTYYRGMLVAGGNFTGSYSNGVDNDLDAVLGTPGSGSYLARWNGTKWQHFGPALDGEVTCMVELSDRLYIGGRFTGGIAKWDPLALTWTIPGSGVNGPVTSIAAYGGSIAAGGDFTATIAGATLSHAGIFDGDAWQPLGAGLAGTVWALYANGSDLYAGGRFRSSGALPLNKIARWANGSWQSLGDGLDDNVYAISMAYGVLYAGGAFYGNDMGSVNSPRLARWTGGVWQPVGSRGMDGDVFAIKPVGNSFWVGGNFETADTTRSVHVAEFNAFPDPEITFWGRAANPNDQRLEFTGIPGQTYRIETSTNLEAWSPFTTAVPSPGIGVGSLPAGLASLIIPRQDPRRFFRVRHAP